MAVVEVPDDILKVAGSLIANLNTFSDEIPDEEIYIVGDITIYWYGEPTHYSVGWSPDYQSFVLKVDTANARMIE